jgi:Na+/H+ antiporter NhaD/arsenite permease-like protein
MIASKAQFGFSDFIIVLTPLATIVMAAFVGLLWLSGGRHMHVREELRQVALGLDPHAAIRDRPMLRRCLGLLALTLAGFFFHRSLQLEPATIALMGASLFMLLGQRSTAGEGAGHAELDYLTEVEWKTILFFIGLFVLIGGLVKSGVIGAIAQTLVGLTHGNLRATTMAILWGSAFVSAVVDNIPYVASMAPVVGTLVGQLPEGTDGTVLWWALALGADLGGNATAIGASANVVVIGLAERSGHRISFLEFTRYGALVTLVTFAVAMPYLWLRYFVLA